MHNEKRRLTPMFRIKVRKTKIGKRGQAVRETAREQKSRSIHGGLSVCFGLC